MFVDAKYSYLNKAIINWGSDLTTKTKIEKKSIDQQNLEHVLMVILETSRISVIGGKRLNPILMSLS